jgi:hypothetical protein
MAMGGVGIISLSPYERRPHQSATNDSKHWPSHFAHSPGLVSLHRTGYQRYSANCRGRRFSETELPEMPILGNPRHKKSRGFICQPRPFLRVSPIFSPICRRYPKLSCTADRVLAAVMRYARSFRAVYYVGPTVRTRSIP